MILKSKKFTNGIDSPSFTIAARNPETFYGWKDNGEIPILGDMLRHHCQNTTKSIVKCIEENTYDLDEVVKHAMIGYNDKISLMDEGYWKEDLTSSQIGRSYTLNLNTTITNNDKSDQIFFFLGFDLSYDLFVHDRNYFIAHSFTNITRACTLKVLEKTQVFLTLIQILY